MNLIHKHGYELFSPPHKTPVLVPELTDYEFLFFSPLDFSKHLKPSHVSQGLTGSSATVNYTKKHHD